MDLTGFDKTHNAYKYRCPLVMKKIRECLHWDSCSRTSYGRTCCQKCDNVHKKAGLTYKSDKWKKIYVNRTSCVRMYNRILNDCNLHKSKMRTDRRLAFQTFLACVNIHGDAWSKTGKQSELSLKKQSFRTLFSVPIFTAFQNLQIGRGADPGEKISNGLLFR